MTLPDPCADVLRDPLCAARESGQPVVLFVSNNVPLELIHAAGCFPLQLPTAPRERAPRADHYLEAGFEPTVRCALEQLLGGELAIARLLVLPRTIDAWQRFYYYACELGRSFGERLPEPFLYNLLHTPFPSSAQYNLQSTRALSDKLAALSGRAVTDDALAGSIALYNRLRGKLARLIARRRATPCQLPGTTALELYTASQRIAPERFETVLDALLGSQPCAAPGVRTLLIGSAHDTPALHAMIARAGGQVVADYHWRGDLLWGAQVRADLPPLEALAEHCHRDTLSTRTFPTPLDRLLVLAADSGAEVAVFCYYAEEEALTWDHPAQAAALQARGLRSMVLERESYPPRPEAEARLRAFFEGSS